MDAGGAFDEMRLARGRRSRVVLTPRRWRQVSRKTNPRGDGDKKARSPGRVRNKLLKPSRAGMPGDPGATVVTNARAFYTTRAAAGATGTRHSPLPPWGSATPSLGRKVHAQLGRNRAAGRRSCVCVHRMLRSDAAILSCGVAAVIRDPNFASARLWIPALSVPL